MVIPYSMPLEDFSKHVCSGQNLYCNCQFTPNFSQLTSFSLYFGDLVHTHSISGIFYFNLILTFQIKAHQAEHVKATEGVLKDLLATQDQEVLCLLKEAAEQEKGKYYSFMVRTCFLNCFFIPQR